MVPERSDVVRESGEMPPDTTVSDTPVPLLIALPGPLEASLDGMIVLDTDHRCLHANTTACVILGCPLEDVIGRGFLLRFPAHEHQALQEQLASGWPRRWSSVARQPEGGECAVECTTQPCVFEGQPAVLVTLRDVSESRRHARKVAALLRIAASMSYGGTLQDTLDTLAYSVVQATGIAACMVMLIDEQRQRLPVAGTHGVPDGYLAALESAWRSGAYMHSIEAYRLQQTRIFSNHHQRLLPDPAYKPMHDLLRTVTWDSGACVPLIYQSRAVGCLVGYFLSSAGPDEAELAFLSAMADQAAVAVENARLVAAAQSAAVLEERHRLARELHDSVSQALFGIGLGVRTAQLQLEREPDRVIKTLEYLRQLAQTGLAEMRALIFDLLPDALATEGIVAALERQLAAISARHSIAVSATLGAEPEAPLVVKEAIYRIAQEALHNTVKHARASRVEVRLEMCLEEMTLEVHDDGGGFAAEGAFPGHLGLRTMRERAKRLGGIMVVESALGVGTRIHVRIPSQQS
jgi:PAS domain S-box-containing protein